LDALTIAPEGLDTESSALVFGRDETARFLDPLCECLMEVAGVSLWGWEKRTYMSNAWATTMHSLRAVCLLVCIMRLIYATGPSFTDYVSVLAVVLFHVWVFTACFMIQQILRSAEFRGMLQSFEGGTGRFLAQKHLVESRWATWGVIILSIAASMCVYVAYMPLFLDGFYTTSSDGFDQFFGFTSAIVFAIAIPGIMGSYFISILLVHLLLSVPFIQMSSAFDDLDPRIADQGMGIFARDTLAAGINTDSQMLTRFQRKWVAASDQYFVMQVWLSTVLHSGLLVMLFLALLPVWYAMFGLPSGLDLNSSAPFGEVAQGFNIFRVVFVSAIGTVNVIVLLLVPMHLTIKLHDLVAKSKRLVFDDVQHKVFMDAVCQADALTYKIGCVEMKPTFPSGATVLITIVSCTPLVWLWLLGGHSIYVGR